MAIQLTSIAIRTEYRVRLVFSGALASGAFAAGPYAVGDVTSGQPLTFKAALAVANQTNQVELVMSNALTQGDAIVVYCTAVPGVDLSTFTGNLSAFFGQSLTFLANAEPAEKQSEDLVFGRDLVHNGQDYVEDDTGDLAAVSGLQNVQTALFRRCMSYGLPWDQGYGPKLEDYVDGPEAATTPATGLIKRQMLSDDRVAFCTVTFNTDTTSVIGAFFQIVVTLKTNRKLPPFDVALKNVSSTDQASP